MESVGIYVHIPFCERRCAYCDFVSCADFSLLSGYFTALWREINGFADAFEAEKKRRLSVDTCFFGGGTPSAVKSEYICETLSLLKKRFDFEEGAEITVECNPNSLTADKAEAYVGAGFNRFSLGVQSADDDILVRIGRLHKYGDFVTAVGFLRSFGVCNINADVMLGLPGGSMDSVRESVKRISDEGVTHVSAYGLEVFPETPLGKSGFVADEDEIARQYDAAVFELDRRGFRRYEISNFALPDRFCRHNKNCWRCREYVGFGAAAASYFGGVRYKNTDVIKDYIVRGGDVSPSLREDVCVIDGDEASREYVMLGLRLAEGVDIREYKARFGKDVRKEYAEKLERYSRYVAVTENNIYISSEYLYVSNSIISDILE